MTNSKQKKRSSFSVIAGITGAVVGAGAAVAGTIALKDKKNRDKVNKVINDVKNQAVGYAEKMQKEISNSKEKIEKNINKKKVEVKKDIDKGKAKVKKIVNISKDAKEKIKKEI